MRNRGSEIPGFIPVEYQEVDYSTLTSQIWEQVRNGRVNPEDLQIGQVAGISFNDSGDLAPESMSALFVGNIRNVTGVELPWSRGKKWDIELDENPYWIAFGKTPISENSPILNAYISPNRDYPISASIFEKPEEIFFAPWQKQRDALGISGGLAFSVTPELMMELDRVAGFIPNMDNLLASYKTEPAIY